MRLCGVWLGSPLPLFLLFAYISRHTQTNQTPHKHIQNDRWHVNERRWGTVSRAVRLPKTADQNNVTAKYEVRAFVWEDDLDRCSRYGARKGKGEPAVNDSQSTHKTQTITKQNGVLRVCVGKMAESEKRKAIRVE